jgi:hypothetical protein
MYSELVTDLVSAELLVKLLSISDAKQSVTIDDVVVTLA